MSQTKVATNFLGAGAVGQIVSVSKTDRFTTSSTSYVDITGFTASITPQSTSSKVLVISNWCWSSDASPYPKFILLRGTTSINIGDSSGSATQVSAGNNTDPVGDEGAIQQEQLGHHFLDSPSSFTLSRAIQFLNVGAETPRQYLMAGSVVVTLPILFIFVYFEKYLVSGLTSGSVKG